MLRPSFRLSLILLLPAALLAQSNVGRVLPLDRPIHVVAFGDFGTGDVHQKAVASAIAKRNSTERFDLGITMGDNFYLCGIRSVKDSKWKNRWENLYTQLGFPFYAALGNHDYGNPAISCLAQRGAADS